MRKPAIQLLTALAITSTLTLPTTAPAADLNVPLPYISIQQAINAAASGDTVLIAPGQYNENISLGGKNITIRAFNTNFDTIIDGGQAGPVVTFSGNETDKCVLRDLIIRNGKAAQGAGITGNGTFAQLRNCTIGGNIATGDGGGIHGFSGTIKNCLITLNQAANGAGIAASNGFIDNCRIIQNKATSSGGGVYNGEGTIQFTEIAANEAATAGGGISQFNGTLLANLIQGNQVTKAPPVGDPASSSWGAGANDVSGTMTLTMILDNHSAGDGGGIANSDATLQNNIIADNSARRGGGLSACTGRVENNTIWRNAALSDGGGCFNMGTLVTNCIIAANTAQTNFQWSGANLPTWSCITGWTGPQPDIISADPLLEDPSRGKFRLMAGSPCIDAGRYIPDLTIDFEGEPRPTDGTPLPAGDGSNFDIGADEYAAASYDLLAYFTSVKTKYKGAYPKLKGKIQGKLVVESIGSENIDAPFGIQFFASADPFFDASDFPVGKYVTAKKLKAGKSKKANCKIKLPLNIAATGFYLIGVADIGNAIGETNEGNNIAVYGPLP